MHIFIEFLNLQNIKKLEKASQIISLIKKEFDCSINYGFNKYHVWTKILSDNLLPLMISRLSKKEKIKYDKRYFTILRKFVKLYIRFDKNLLKRNYDTFNIIIFISF